MKTELYPFLEAFNDDVEKLYKDFINLKEQLKEKQTIPDIDEIIKSEKMKMRDKVYEEMQFWIEHQRRIYKENRIF